MLSINSSFYDIENAHLKNNKNIKSIANEMNVGENKLRKLLIAMGYYHDTSLRKWQFKKTNNEDLRGMSFQEFDELSKGNTSNINVTQKVIKSNNDITENVIKDNKDITVFVEQSNTGNIFSNEEILILKDIVKAYSKKQSVNLNDSILERISNLPVHKKERKTFLIDNNLIEKFDLFCDQNRLKMSDVMSIAIIDLLNKYKK